jgi:hypothetical protein
MLTDSRYLKKCNRLKDILTLFFLLGDGGGGGGINGFRRNTEWQAIFVLYTRMLVFVI